MQPSSRPMMFQASLLMAVIFALGTRYKVQSARRTVKWLPEATGTRKPAIATLGAEGKLGKELSREAMAEFFRTRIALAFMIVLSASAWREKTAFAEDVLSPLVGIPVATPNPVLGADDKTH